MFPKKHVGYFFHQLLVMAVVAAVVGIVVHNTTSACKTSSLSIHPLACVAEQFEAPALPNLNNTTAILTSVVLLLIVLAVTHAKLPKPVLTLSVTIRHRFHIHIREGTRPFAKHLFLPTLCAIRDP